MPVTAYIPEEIAEYINILRDLKYWEVIFKESSLRKDKSDMKNSADFIRRGISNYKEKVPKEIRELININIGELEAQCSRVLDVHFGV